MEVFKNLFHGRGYIDGITIINLAGEILFTAKFNNLLNSSAEDNCEVVGKSFFDIYDKLTADTSTIFKSMELGLPIYVEKQKLEAKGRESIEITSLSIPIKSGNRVVGAIDLSSLELQARESSSILKINKDIFIDANISKLCADNTSAPFTVENILSNNERMCALKAYVEIAGNCNLPVMICGETGTGKELFAQSIHNSSKRKKAPFIVQNCASIPDNLLESILFGTSKGAFTGAIDNIGLLELADGGTLFLDEINSMPIPLQAKLLRVLQDGTFRSVGSKEVKRIDVKIISAINTEPMEAIRTGELRKDIYYRLSTMLLKIPPLRERKDDIPLLVDYNICKYNTVFEKNVKYVSQEIYSKLMSYDWPGNIRELEHVIVYGLSVIDGSKEELAFADIEYKFDEMMEMHNVNRPKEIVSLKDEVENYEKKLIAQAVLSADHNIVLAAKMLKIPRQTLQRKIKNYAL